MDVTGSLINKLYGALNILSIDSADTLMGCVVVIS